MINGVEPERLCCHNMTDDPHSSSRSAPPSITWNQVAVVTADSPARLIAHISTCALAPVGGNTQRPLGKSGGSSRLNESSCDLRREQQRSWMEAVASKWVGSSEQNQRRGENGMVCPERGRGIRAEPSWQAAGKTLSLKTVLKSLLIFPF